MCLTLLSEFLVKVYRWLFFFVYTTLDSIHLNSTLDLGLISTFVPDLSCPPTVCVRTSGCTSAGPRHDRDPESLTSPKHEDLVVLDQLVGVYSETQETLEIKIINTFDL